MFPSAAAISSHPVRGAGLAARSPRVGARVDRVVRGHGTGRRGAGPRCCPFPGAVPVHDQVFGAPQACSAATDLAAIAQS